MRNVSLEEYFEEKKKFEEKNAEYLRKLEEIVSEENKAMNPISDDEERKKMRRIFEEKKNQLKDEYDDYTSIYKAKFYVWVTLDNVTKLCSYPQHIKLLRKSIHKYIGRHVQPEARASVHGKCIGIACFLDDFAWVIKDEVSGKETFTSTICGVDYYRKPKSYTMVTNGRDYL